MKTLANSAAILLFAIFSTPGVADEINIAGKFQSDVNVEGSVLTLAGNRSTAKTALGSMQGAVKVGGDFTSSIQVRGSVLTLSGNRSTACTAIGSAQVC